MLVDEAHRLTEKSGMFSNLGENQIKEIIDASKVSIFFIDEHQRISIKDIGSKAEIEKWAAYHGAELYHQKLVSQFRCDGSDGYLAWIDNVLEIDETANYHLKDIDYDFQVMDSPHHLKEKIVQLNASGKNSRILAGYCWEWPKSNRRDTHFHDIVIGDFSMSWNLDSTMTYAIDKDSVNEIGCIHTSQGLEFDYVGVIIGEDLRFENDMIVTDFNKRAKSDSSLKGIKSMYKEDPSRAMALADEIIKNTYRTLMTRGLKGCYVYCVDPGLQEYLKERMKSGDKY